MVATLTAIFSADLYFILLPKLESVRHGPGRSCSCRPDNFTIPRLGGLTTPLLSNQTSLQPVDINVTEPVAEGSKLEKLFVHPLYNIQFPGLTSEERLLEAEQLMEYYKKKASRWERSVSNVVFLQF